jgi:protein-L-isoaspartate(D-aspartate) O-methyltransferase
MRRTYREGVPTLDERAGRLRAAMVDALIAQGVHDARVLAAMRVIPRHPFAVAGDVGDDLLAEVHDVSRAIPIRTTGGTTTATVSAPNIVAIMLQALAVEPGMRVLEIGTGSGYNAALLAHLGAEVTTVDIDSSLIEPARARLRELGLDDVAVVDGDGDLGVPARAPFDRVIATVGCNDISPAWFDQLTPTGRMLVPVFHGAGHPMLEVHADRTSRVLGPSGFVAVQGRQANQTWWSSTPARVDHSAARSLTPRERWDVALYIALRARRGGSARLVDDWESLGRPPMERYTARWEPRTGVGDVERVAGPWRIPRVHHDEVVRLNPA